MDLELSIRRANLSTEGIDMVVKGVVVEIIVLPVFQKSGATFSSARWHWNWEFGQMD